VLNRETRNVARGVDLARPSRGKRARKPIKINGFDLATVKNLLRGNPSRLRTVFGTVRGSLRPEDYRPILNAFRDQPYYKIQVFGEAFPKNLAQLKRLSPLPALSVELEFSWACATIETFASKLGEFIIIEKAIFKCVAEDDYVGAAEHLDGAEAEFGLSFWLYAVKFFLQAKITGAESNNALYTEIRSAPGINGLTYFIIFYLGFRLSSGSTVEHIREQVPLSPDGQEPIWTYTFDKLTPLSYSTSKTPPFSHALALLRHDGTSSVVDLLGAFRRASGILASSGMSLALVGPAAARAGSAIDAEATNIAAVIEDPARIVKTSETERVLTCLDSIYANGDEIEPSSLSDLIGALGWAGQSPDGVSAELRNLISELSSFSPDRTSAAERLEQLCTTLSGFERSFAVFGIAKRLWRGSMTLSIFGSLEAIGASGFVLPDIAEFVDGKTATAILSRLEELYGQRPSIDAFKQLTAKKGRLNDTNFSRFIEVVKMNAQGEPSLALKHADAISVPSSPVRNVDGMAARLLLAASRVDDAVILIARIYLRDQSAWSFLPIEEAAEAGIKGGTLSDLLSWSIVLDAACRHVDQRFARHRAYAVEDAWEARGLEMPSQLPGTLNADENLIAIYYLRHLCTSDILGESDRFLSVRALEEERIRVCQALSDMDATNAEDYLSEIKSITRWLVIYDGFRSIEKSKIYVDIGSLKQELISSLAPEYDRMLALRRERNALGDVNELIGRDMAKYRDDEIITNVLLRYAFDDPQKILSVILTHIQAEYASNSRFGLDVYLSTRIRHGTLKGYLRSPLEDANLACQRSGTEYKDQEYWVERIATVSGSPEAHLLKAIREFSAFIDDEISQINSSYLRLQSKENPNGWFVIPVLESDISAITSYLENNSPDVAEFISGVLDVLNHRLGITLVHVQNQLYRLVRAGWLEQFARLRSAATNTASDVLRSEFEAAVASAQVASDLAISRVAQWFTLSTAKENPDYTIEFALEIAARSIDNCFGSQVLSILMSEAEGPMLQGRTLASLVDVFFILFENIVRHSRSGDSVRANVSVARSDRFYTIAVRNELLPDADKNALAKRVLAIKESLVTDSGERVSKEGGSGYHKIRKILGHDLAIDHDFDFGIVGESYDVTLYLDAQAVMA
jgi:hypothetical protein